LAKTPLDRIPRPRSRGFVFYAWTIQRLTAGSTYPWARLDSLVEKKNYWCSSYIVQSEVHFLRAKAAMLSACLSHRNSVCPSICHTGGSGKNGPS